MKTVLRRGGRVALPLIAALAAGLSTVLLMLAFVGRPLDAGMPGREVNRPTPQEPDLELTLTATDPLFYADEGIQVWVSIENKTSDSLNIAKSFPVIYLRDLAGQRYEWRTQGLFGPLPHPWWTTEPPGAVIVRGSLVRYLYPIDEQGNPLPEQEDLLQPGEYEIEAHFSGLPPELHDPEKGRFSEGYFVSNTVNVTVVLTEQEVALAARPRLRQSDPKLGRLAIHRGTGLVRAKALAAYEIAAKADGEEFLLTRAGQEVKLPVGRTGKPEPGGPPLPAISQPGGMDHYVPLRYVAENLGLRVTYDAQERLYDLVAVDK